MNKKGFKQEVLTSTATTYYIFSLLKTFLSERTLFLQSSQYTKINNLLIIELPVTRINMTHAVINPIQLPVKSFSHKFT